MTSKDYRKFEALMELCPPPKNKMASIEQASRNWYLLYQELAKMKASDASLNTCRHFMYVELNREEGPRYHIMDRLYKRFSNLRREIETSAMLVLIPEAAEAA